MAAPDPRELFELEADRPDVRGAVLLEAMDGFIDAGSTIKIARRHLLDVHSVGVLARFDVDTLFDYRARRPLMRFERDHWASYEQPQLAVHLLRDADGTSCVMLAGPEPDVQWERFVAAVRLLIDALGLGLTAGFNAFPMSLPHTRPTRVILHGSRPELYAGYQPWLGTIGVPASAGHLLEYRLGEAGLDALGLAVPVPPYLADSEYPVSALALLREVANRTGLRFDLDALETAAQRSRTEIDAQVAQSEEVQALVRALEAQYDAYVQEQPLADDESRLPSGEELGAELERFLADQARGDNPPPL